MKSLPITESLPDSVIIVRSSKIPASISSLDSILDERNSFFIFLFSRVSIDNIGLTAEKVKTLNPVKL
jgi:hypothetical protein